MPRIESRLWVKRNGVRYAQLNIDYAQNMSVSCNNDAEIKMRLNVDAWWDGAFNYNTDSLVPVLLMDDMEYQLGEYIITGSTLSSDGIVNYYSLLGYDKCYLAKKYRVESRPFFAAGTLYTSALSQLLTQSRITDFEVEPSSLVMQSDREDWEPGTPYIEIINQLLGEMNYNSVYMNLDGVVICSPYRNPAIENVDVEYINDPNTSILVPGASIEVDGFDHPNVFHYFCDNPDNADESWVAISENNDPGNKFSIAAQGRVARFVRMDSVASQETLQAIADRARLDSMISSDTITFKTGLNPTHNPFSIISIRKNEFSGILEEREWSLDVGINGGMSHVARRVSYD